MRGNRWASIISANAEWERNRSPEGAIIIVEETSPLRGQTANMIFYDENAFYEDWLIAGSAIVIEEESHDELR